VTSANSFILVQKLSLLRTATTAAAIIVIKVTKWTDWEGEAPAEPKMAANGDWRLANGEW